jgi:hypothetical protein
MIIDHTAQMIYGHADSKDFNSWLRTLAYIRRLPQTWPTRWSSKDGT